MVNTHISHALKHFPQGNEANAMLKHHWQLNTQPAMYEKIATTYINNMNVD